MADVRSTNRWASGRLPRLLQWGALALLVGSCGILGPELDESGVVHYLDLEGGCWVIETDAQQFRPTELPLEFQVDGMWVVYAAHRVDELSFCPGQAIELESIGALPE